MVIFGKTFWALGLFAISFLIPGHWCEASDLRNLYLKNGETITCDSIWKSTETHVWCSKSLGVIGYRMEDIDQRRTFEIQPYVNRLMRESEEGFFKGDLDEIIRRLTEILALEPENERLYAVRAGVYAYKGALEEALRDAIKALEINPDSALAHHNLGIVYEKTGEKVRAKDHFLSSCQDGIAASCEHYYAITGVRPDEITSYVVTLLDKSRSHFHKGEWDSVVMLTTEALYLDPRNEIAYTNRSGAYANKGLLRVALEDGNKAVELNPDFGLAHNNRGYALELLDRKEAALSDYDRGCKLGEPLGCKNFKRLSNME